MADPVAPDWHASQPVPKEAYVPAIGEPEPDEWVEGDHPTENPDGVTNSNEDYYPKTQEEKAALLGVEMVDPVEIAPEEPYPEGTGPEPREDLLRRIHSPQELVAGEDMAEQLEKNLAAGGSVTPDEVMVSI